LSKTDIDTADERVRIAPRAGANAEAHARMAKKAITLDIILVGVNCLRRSFQSVQRVSKLPLPIEINIVALPDELEANHIAINQGISVPVPEWDPSKMKK
jgi:hypothetical protein